MGNTSIKSQFKAPGNMKVSLGRDRPGPIVTYFFTLPLLKEREMTKAEGRFIHTPGAGISV